MPRMLFEDAAAARTGPSFARRRGLSVPASMAVHALVLAAFLVVQIVGPVSLPPLPSPALRAWVVSIAAMPETAVPRPRRQAPVEAVQAAAAGAPVEAPQGIEPETGVEVSAEMLAAVTRDTSGLAAGVETGLPDAPVVVPPPPPIEPVRPGGHIEMPARVVYVAPVYPPVAQAARLEGLVIIEATIDPSGAVVGARVLRSAPLLDDAALAAVRQWRYTPTLLNGVPVPVILTVTVQFKIRDAL